jgi:hypothetical protein
MKRKKVKSMGGEMAAVPPQAATSVASHEPKKEETVAMPAASVASSSECGPPDPGYLLAMAQEEPEKTLLSDYMETIRVLRDEKDFSFRDIAEWLTNNGVPTDHNAVYREYMDWALDPQAYDLERDQDAMERAEEDAELGR